MENRYLDEGWNNRPNHCVYGFRLRPFCLYYLHLLQSIDSPLLKPKRRCGAKDILIGAEICSSPWSEEGYTLDRILSPNQVRLRRNQLRLLTERFSTQTSLWMEYYQDFLVVAKKWENVGTGEGPRVASPRRFDLDRVMAIATSIIMASHWEEKKVMMMPIGKAFGYDDYFAIKQGAKIQFFTAKDEEVQRKTEAAIAAENAVKAEEAHAQPAPQ